MDIFQRALGVTRVQVQQGPIDGRHAVWLLLAWAALAVESLANVVLGEETPGSAASVLHATWWQVAGIVDNAILPRAFAGTWKRIRSRVPRWIDRAVRWAGKQRK